jgi:hypothetical protein
MNNEGSTLTATIKGTKSSLTIDDEEYFDIDLGDYEIYVVHTSKYLVNMLLRSKPKILVARQHHCVCS